MAWIESHQALGHHPKTLRLATQLRCRVPEAVGLLHFLWWWALDYAPNGRVTTADATIVARACLWHGSPERLWDGLVRSGFLEQTDAELGTYQIHDWQDYAGRLIQKRAANVARSRRARSANGVHTERATNAHGTGLPTVPTVQNSTEPPRSPPTPCRVCHANPVYAPAGLDDAPDPRFDGLCARCLIVTQQQAKAKVRA
jgi:hypothetical protein